MEIFEGEVVLSVSPEDAFAIIGDPANASRIDPMIRSYEPEGGTMHEGGLNHIRGRLSGLPYRVVSRTDVWDPPRRMVMAQVRPARPARMTLIQTFEPHPDGTLVRYRTEIEATVPGAGFVARALRRSIARNFAEGSSRLRDLVSERSKREPPGGGKS